MNATTSVSPSAAAPVEILELHQKRESFDVRAKSFEQPRRSGRRAARREQVVDHQHALALLQGVGVNLERVGAVLERILFGQSIVRQLARLTNGDETGTDGVSDRRAENVTARLDGDDVVDFRGP